MTEETPDAARRRKPPAPQRRGKGFHRAAEFTPGALKSAGAKRGFAELRLLTEWRAIAGDALAAICRPTKVTYGGRGGGLGAALVLAAEGARAPEIEMQKAQIVERVNAFYGYRAISRISIDQSRAPLLNAPEPGAGAEQDAPRPAPRPLANVADPGLALALARLGANVKAKAARAHADGPQSEQPSKEH